MPGPYDNHRLTDPWNVYASACIIQAMTSARGNDKPLAADGAAVAFTYGASTAEAEKLAVEVAADGATVVAIQADAADPEQVTRSVDETVDKLGGLDILVNNAGIAILGDAATFPPEQFEKMVAINIRGGSLRSRPRWHISARAGASSTSAASTPTRCRVPDSRCTR